ncbi:MAG: PRC-barrel domain-containing protein [Candidatus Berkelbacteria bacterium]|nr:PRC-barrel domain-containing protein [Candidatus Berkelbacteria bacterium]
MLISSLELKGGEIISLESGSSIGEIRDPIVDPINGKILAFDVGTGFLTKRLILSSTDIIEWQRNALIVYGMNVLVEPIEVKRVLDLIKKRFKLIGKRALTQKGVNLGRISDIYIDTTTSMVAKYNITHHIFASFLEEGRIIPANLVVKIDNKKGVIFKDSVAEGNKGKAAQTKTATT